MEYFVKFWKQTWPPSLGDDRRWNITISGATKDEKDEIMKVLERLTGEE